MPPAAESRDEPGIFVPAAYAAINPLGADYAGDDCHYSKYNSPRRGEAREKIVRPKIPRR